MRKSAVWRLSSKGTGADLHPKHDDGRRDPHRDRRVVGGAGDDEGPSVVFVSTVELQQVALNVLDGPRHGA